MDVKVIAKIAKLMQEVKNAALESDVDQHEYGYIDDVNRRIGEIEDALLALKHELTKHGLNDW